jgi:hypothetical protein
MRIRREHKFLAWGAAAIAMAAAAFVIGGELKPADPPHYLFDVEAPAFQADVGAIAATSQGGFTGFGELDGASDRTVVGGRVVEVSPTSLTLETPEGSRTTLRLGANSKLSKLDAGARAQIRPGANVLVKQGEQEGEAEAVLVLSQ